MPTSTVPPLANQPFANWVYNFAEKLSFSPGAYGVDPADALAVTNHSDQYHALLALCNDPRTRTRIAVTDKDVAKAACLAKARAVLRKVGAHAALTPGQREELGMNPRADHRSPVAAPSSRPFLILRRDGTVRVSDENTPDTRAKPPGARGAIISMRLGGDAPPLTPADAHFGAVATRGRARLPIPPGSNGQRLWAIAQWFTDRGELGAVSAAVSVVIAA